MKKQAFKMYGIAVENRAREIDLFWKRATFFWAFQIAALAVIALAIDDKVTSFDDLNAINWLIICVGISLGLVASFSGYLSARGSKYWQEVWEKKVELLEHEFPLFRTKTYVSIKFAGAGTWSVSKQVVLFIFYTFILWALAALGAFAVLLHGMICNEMLSIAAVGGISLLVPSVLYCIAMCLFGRTNGKMIIELPYETPKESKTSNAKQQESKRVSDILNDRQEFDPRQRL